MPDLIDLAAGRAPALGVTHATWLRGFLQRRIEGLTLVDLHVSATAHTRWEEGESRWVLLTGTVTDAERGACVAEHGDEPGSRTILKTPTGWTATHVAVGPAGNKAELPMPGHLWVFHGDPVAAKADAPRLGTLAEDVALALRLLRTARDRRAMSDWAGLLADFGVDRVERLRRLAAKVQGRMRADGAKIYLLRRAPHGADVHLAARSDIEARPAVPYALSDREGMADHVVRRNEWLLIASALPEEQRGQQDEVGLGPGGAVRCRPRKDSDTKPDYGRDDEASMLLVPMRLNGHAVGAVYVWRRKPDGRAPDPPFDERFDRAHLEAFAEQLALAGLGWVQSEVAELEAGHLAQLGQPATTPQDLHGRLAAAIGTLTRAAGCLLLLRDEGSLDGPCYYSAATWWRDSGPHLVLVQPATVGVEEVRGAVSDVLAQVSKPAHTAVRDVHVWPDPRHDRPAGLFVTLTAAWPAEGQPLPPAVAPTGAGHRPFDDAVLTRAVPHLLGRLTPALVESLEHVQVAMAELDDSGQSDAPTADQLRATLRQALLLAWRHTGADAALYYRLEGNTPIVAECVPESAGAMAHRPGPQTVDVLREAKPMRQLRHTSARQAATGAPSPLAASLGWEPAALQSWLCVPVGEGRSAWGVFKLVTKPGGMLLAAAHERVAARLAAHVARVADRLRRHAMIEQLNEDASRWARHAIVGLGAAMGHDLKRWLKAWIHPRAGLAVVASMGGQRPEVFARADLDADIGNDDLVKAAEIRIQATDWRQPGTWRPHGRRLWAQPIGLQARADMRGYLTIWSPTELTAPQQEAAAEAAREVAIALERVSHWHQWQLERSVFRHAILAPVQGLRSAALEAVELAREVGAAREPVQEIAIRVQRESSALQLWRDNERFQLDPAGGLDVEPHKHRIQVGEIVQVCERRFKDVLAGRAQHLRTHWRLARDFVAVCDSDLIELALANLLDNAHKYAFAASEIVLGISRDRGVLAFWVEDEGNGIAPADREAIYQVGRRATIDPVRNIDGSGLGLPIARAIAWAHHGKLTHTVTALRTVTRTGVRVHRVRFTLTLEA